MIVRAKFKRREELPPEALCCDFAYSTVSFEPFLVDTDKVKVAFVECGSCGWGKPSVRMLYLADGSGYKVPAYAVDLEEGL